MARFVITMQANLQASPPQIRNIVRSINNQLRGINATVNLNLNNGQINGFNRNINNARNGVQGLTNDMERFGEQAAQAIRRYGAFTLATTAFLKLTSSISAGIQDAIKFDREIVRIAQVTGQSTESLKALSSEVTRLSTTFGVASEEILESAVTLSQAGLSAEQTRIALEALAKTGVSATFGDVKETTEAAIAAMQQFGYQAKDLEQILGSINSVSAAFAVESDDIAVAIRRAGGAFEAAGGNLNEFQALFTSVRQTTRESAESIATGFRTIFARLQRVRTQNFLKNLGIDVLNEQGLFVGPFEAIRKLSTALKDLDSADPRFAQVIEELGGFRQVSKVIPLIEKFDVSQKALNIAIRGGNSLTKDAEVAQQSLAIQIAKVREEFTALLREIANNQLFKESVKTALALASALIKVGNALTPLIPLIGLVGAARIGPNVGSFARGFGRRISGFSDGGSVPGQGDSDTVPAMLTPGEFVITKRAAQSIGYNNLSRLNRTGNVRGYNRGGVVGYARGGRVSSITSSLGGIGGIGFGLTAISAFTNNLGDADSALTKVISTLGILGGQIALTNTIYKEGSRSLLPLFDRFNGMRDEFARNRQRAAGDTISYSVNRYANTGQSATNEELDAFESQRRQRLNRASRLRQQRTGARNAAIGSAITGVGLTVGGFVSDNANQRIANGEDATRQAAAGGLISGAATGAGIGAIFGPWGMAIGAATGGLIGFYQSLGAAEKELRSVAFDKQLTEVGKILDRVNKGNLSTDGATGSISRQVLEAFSTINETTGTERSDLSAKFRNQASGIEDFFLQVAKGSKDFNDFTQKTGDTLDEFAALADIPFGDLRNQVEGVIKAEKEAAVAAARFTAATRASNDLKVVLDSFSTALTTASYNLNTFGASLDEVEAGIDFRGSAFKSFNLSELFKQNAAGEFNNPGQVAGISRNLLTGFGQPGGLIANQVSDISKARSLVPDLIRQFASNPLKGEEAAPQDFIADSLKKANISQSVIDSVVGGISTVIGSEAKPSILLQKFNADPTQVVEDVFDSLKGFDNVMASLSTQISEHADRMAKGFELSAKVQDKINTLELDRIDNIIALQDKIQSNIGTPAPIGTGAARDRAINQRIGGTSDVSVQNLFERARTAQSNITGLTNTINDRQRQGLNINNELFARQRNITILEQSTTALQKMTKSGYEFAEIEERLARAGEQRRFRRDNIINQAFGSRDDKRKEAESIALVSALVRGMTTLDRLNDQGKDLVKNFLTENRQVSFPGLGGATGEDILRKLLVQDQTRKIVQNEGLGPQDALSKALQNVGAALDGTEEEVKLRKDLIGVTSKQNEAITALQKLLANKDPLNTGLLAQENNRFLTELNNIFVSNLVNAEKVRIGQANSVLDRRDSANKIPATSEQLNAARINRQAKIDADKAAEQRGKNLESLDKEFVKLGQNPSRETLRGFGSRFGLSETEITAANLRAKANNRNPASEVRDLANRKIIESASKQIQAADNSRVEESPTTRRLSLREIDAALEAKKNAPTPTEVQRAENQKKTSQDSIRELEKSLRPNQPPGQPVSYNPSSRIDNSVAGMNQFANNLQDTVNQMDGLQMELVATHNVNVTLNGGEVLARMNESVRGMIEQGANQALAKLVNENPGLRMPVA